MEENKNSQKSIPFKQLVRTLIWIFKIFFSIRPMAVIAFFITKTVKDLMPLMYAFIFARSLDEVIRISQTPSTDFWELIPYFGVMLAYGISIDAINYSINLYCRRVIGLLSSTKLDQALYTHLHYIGVQALEDPEVANIIQRANQNFYQAFDILIELADLVAQIVRIIVTGTTLFTFMPILIPILSTIAILQFIPDRYFTQRDYKWRVDNTEKRRIAYNSGWMLGNPNSLGEITLTGAFDFLSKKHINFFSWFNAGLVDIVKKRYITYFIIWTIDSVVKVSGYMLVFYRVFLKQISVGSVFFYIRAFEQFSAALSTLFNTISTLNDQVIKLRDVIALFEIKPAIVDGNIEFPRFTEGPEIEFKNVTFTYPKTEKNILEDFNLKIKPGEKIAIVGQNGAGKTTLVKLLARLYDTKQGEIRVNGIDLKDVKLGDWYKNIGVLFQEYNFYGSLSVKENIYIGRSSKPIDEEKIILAAKNADAHDFIMEYKNKYDQIMSESFEGGIRPSTGQKQKISIARFFYRDAPFVIFDEPTAAIDAVAEYKIFNKIYDSFKKKTVIIISHRFSTVRNADRIIVMDKGKIAEEGSHKELLAKDGIYAHAYKLQAEGYKD